MPRVSRGVYSPKCTICGSIVHASARCPWQGNEHLSCYKCGQYGHWKKYCAKPDDCYKCASKLRTQNHCGGMSNLFYRR
ncbi:hypothetical protein BDV18DRAFT_69398 [Aspergillus unguis]